jgi:hypothetical protein
MWASHWKEWNMASQYEFSSEENAVLGDLGRKMRFVGLFAVVLGVLNIIIALLVVVAVYRDRIPAEWKAKTMDYVKQAHDKLPEDVKKQADQYSLDKLPPNNHLWGIALNLGVVGLFYLLMGGWTRSAGTSFEKIVSTQGSDISHLMTGLGSLRSMYSLLYTLLVVVLIFGIIGIGFTIYHEFLAR